MPIQTARAEKHAMSQTMLWILWGLVLLALGAAMASLFLVYYVVVGHWPPPLAVAAGFRLAATWQEGPCTVALMCWHHCMLYRQPLAPLTTTALHPVLQCRF
jgi:hypothetical protein